MAWPPAPANASLVTKWLSPVKPDAKSPAKRPRHGEATDAKPAANASLSTKRAHPITYPPHGVSHKNAASPQQQNSRGCRRLRQPNPRLYYSGSYAAPIRLRRAISHPRYVGDHHLRSPQNKNTPRSRTTSGCHTLLMLKII
jgi:hypothetical protein